MPGFLSGFCLSKHLPGRTPSWWNKAAGDLWPPEQSSPPSRRFWFVISFLLVQNLGPLRYQVARRLRFQSTLESKQLPHRGSQFPRWARSTIGSAPGPGGNTIAAGSSGDVVADGGGRRVHRGAGGRPSKERSGGVLLLSAFSEAHGGCVCARRLRLHLRSASSEGGALGGMWRRSELGFVLARVPGALLDQGPRQAAPLPTCSAALTCVCYTAPAFLLAMLPPCAGGPCCSRVCTFQSTATYLVCHCTSTAAPRPCPSLPCARILRAQCCFPCGRR